MADGFDWQALSTILGSQAQAQGDAKTAQNTTALDQFKAELSGRIAQQNAASKRAQDIRMAPTARLAQGATGDFVGNWQPVNVEWGGQGTRPVVTGGVNSMRPSENTTALATAMTDDAMVRSKQGWDSPDIAPFMQMPNPPTMSKANWFDSLLGGAGGLSSILGLLKGMGAGKGDGKNATQAGGGGGGTTGMMNEPSWSDYWNTYEPGLTQSETAPTNQGAMNPDYKWPELFPQPKVTTNWRVKDSEY